MNATSAELERWNLTLLATSRGLGERREALKELHDRGLLPPHPTSRGFTTPWIQRLIQADSSAAGHPHTQVLIADLVERGHPIDATWMDAQGRLYTALRQAVERTQAGHVQSLLALGADTGICDARGAPLPLIGTALQALSEYPRTHSKSPDAVLTGILVPLMRHGASVETGMYFSRNLSSVVGLHPLLNKNTRHQASAVEAVIDAFLDARVQLGWPATLAHAKELIRLLSVATPGQWTRILPQLSLDQPVVDSDRSLGAHLAATEPKLQARLRQHGLNQRPATASLRARRRS